ncbi:hypothetical protein LTR66_001369 [Elasticomyces elasticus]|nr:hypothetical protein LTR66_001369 [Elasticomyces elasticus]
MHAVWSRLAPTRSTCRCSACLSIPAGIVSRRAAAATTKKGILHTYSSSLLYSGIFAAALTADARVKRDRTEQWDRAIADVKQELGDDRELWAVEQRERVRNEYALDRRKGQELEQKREIDGEETIYWGGGRDADNCLKPSKEDTALYVRFEETDEQATQSFYVRSEGMRGAVRAQWLENTGSHLKLYHVSPESVYASLEVREKALHRRWTPKKMYTMELSVQKMILRLLLRLKKQGADEVAAVAVPEAFRPMILRDTFHLEGLLLGTQQKLDAVRHLPNNSRGMGLGDGITEPLYRPSYRQDDLGAYHTTTASLNTALHIAFADHNVKLRDVSPGIIAKTCYNLLASSAPPNLETYNTLLVHLSRSRTAELADIVISSILETHVRMNEITLSMILMHNVKTNNAGMFKQFVQKMRGQRNGLALARPGVCINEASNGRLVRKGGPEGTEKIIQKPCATPKVFDALVQGVLHFAGFDAAVRICKDMGHEGWGLSVHGLISLLRDCATRSDWDAGTAVWQQIKTLQEQSRWRVAGKESSAKRDRGTLLSAYGWMLSLCQVCEKESRFHELFEEALRRKDPQGEFVLLKLLKRNLETMKEYGLVQVQQVSSRPQSKKNEAATVDHPTAPLRPRSGLEIEHDDSPTVLQKLSSTAPSITPLDTHKPLQDEAITSTEPAAQSESPIKPATDAPPKIPSHYTEPPLLLDHLDGSLAVTPEFDDYEIGERPMSVPFATTSMGRGSHGFTYATSFKPAL